jgi:hypothetical protein
VRILYRAAGADEFDFIVPPARGVSRGAYAPDGEIRGIAKFEDGALVIRELTLTRGSGLNGLTLRAVPLGEIRAQILEDFREHPKLLEAAAGEFVPATAARRLGKRARMAEASKVEIALQELRARSPLRGRPNDDFYRSVAVAYLVVSYEHPRDPVAALTSELRKSRRHRQLSQNTVTGWVRKARELGWLTPAVHGRAGAESGDRLRAWSSEQWQQLKRQQTVDERSNNDG